MAYDADFNPKNEQMRVSYLTGAGFDNYLSNLKDLSGGLWHEIRSTISEFKPAVVGISAKSQNFASARLVAKLAKEIDKRIIVIVGGPHPSMVGADVLNCPDIDVCVKGEGERTIVELLNAIDMQKEFDNIPGVFYRRKDGEVVHNAPRQFIEDMDSLCFPHESASEVLKNYEHYPKTAFNSIMATRGCPHNCFFCGSREIWSRKVRFRSPENVVREIKALQEKGIRRVCFVDDFFGVNRKYISDLCNAFMAYCPGIKWSCELCVNLVDDQTISLMKETGCIAIAIGIESGNNEILKKMRKNITIEQALSACKIIKNHGIELQALFIIGFPQETEKTLNDTVVAMKRCKCDDIAYSIFTPYPGTEAFEFCKKNGLINDTYDVSLYNHHSPANCFCINITPERFRTLASKIERMVDRKNSTERVKRVFSLNIFTKVQELGIRRSFKEGVKLLVAMCRSAGK